RALRARASFRSHLPLDYAGLVEFYDPDRYMPSAPLRDNLLFGRITYGAANAQPKVYAAARAVLSELGLDPYIYGLGLDFQVGKGGKLLRSVQRTRIALARGLVARPDILILENALLGLPPTEIDALLKRLQRELDRRTLIATFEERDETHGFDR